MKKQRSTQRIKGYCSQCSCWCPTLSYVRDGTFIKVESDKEHPLTVPLCPKGLAGPELVYNKQRLQYPMRRTRPKGSLDPGWERITWNEALDTIATKLKEIKTKFGPEAVAFTRSGPAGSPMAELWPWIHRLADAFGSPNFLGTTHICQWHRDHCSAYTYGKPGIAGAAGRAEFERAGCILIWGNNTHASRSSFIPFIERGLAQGARLIVIDPMKTKIAGMADLWLQVCPGTDGVLALSMINVIIEDNLYDYGFVRDWTSAPFLVRSDTGNLLKGSDLTDDGDASSYVVLDSISTNPETYLPGKPLSDKPALDTSHTVKLANGEHVECKTVFQLLREAASEYLPSRAEALTGVPKDKIRDAARMFATSKPACWYPWLGIEQSINASQTNRAICILYALTGDYDKPGGNVLLPRLARNSIEGREFLSPEVESKRLGFKERPLGPAGITARNIQAYDLYDAILTGNPYPVKALVGFGGNLITSNPSPIIGREAISQLDFFVQAELFLTPTAELADIVLPAASSWESWHIGVNFAPLGEKAYIQLRPAVVPPQHESWPDLKIMFELAKKLNLGDKFWDGDIEAAFDYQFAPSHITVGQLRKNPGGFAIQLSMEYQKYNNKDSTGNLSGFPTSSKRVELYSQLFKDHGYAPLPTWKEPITSRLARTNLADKYPLILTGTKVVEYCHSQHRALPSLRTRVPHPFLDINPPRAKELGLRDGDWIILETPHSSITLQAKLTQGTPYNVVSTQNGWWQGCPELNLPGYDPYSPEGANVNLLYVSEEKDPISGSVPIKGYPCNIKKAKVQDL